MLRVVFMGTPDFAVPTLAAIVAAGHQVAAVYTQPPRPAGRGMDERKSAVHRFAEQPASACTRLAPSRSRPTAGLRRPESRRRRGRCLWPAFAQAGSRCPARRLPEPARVALPRWRGAAPIQRAIMAGDTETAAAVMRMDEGLDTGPICLEERMAIGPDMTAGELHDGSRNGARA